MLYNSEICTHYISTIIHTIIYNIPRVSIFQQKCVDFNQRLGPKICGFDQYIRTIYGPDIQYDPYIVAIRNIVK